MSNKVWSVVKFKVKPGCEEQFLKAHNFSDENMSHSLLFRAVQIDDGLVAYIAKYQTVDKAFEAQDQGLDWLYSIEHLIDYFDDSRTEAFSGIELYSKENTSIQYVFKRLSFYFGEPH